MFKQFSNGLFEQDREEKEANIQRRVVSKFKKLSNFEIQNVRRQIGTEKFPIVKRNFKYLKQIVKFGN